MNARSRTRTDYHFLYSSPSAPAASRPQLQIRWLKPVFWLGLGFIGGMVYTKLLMAPRAETIALSAVAEKVVVESKSTKHQAGKGANSSKV